MVSSETRVATKTIDAAYIDRMRCLPAVAHALSEQKRAMTNSTIFILSSADVQSLTLILRLPSGQDPITYSNNTISRIRKLPTTLQKQTALIEYFSIRATPTILCSLHKRLNRAVVHQIFNLIGIEVGGRLNHLAVNIKHLPDEYQCLVTRVRGVHQLWLGVSQFCHTFQTEPSREWPPQKDGCEACSIARMMGNSTFIRDLLIIVRSRRSRYENPLIVRWLESWYRHDTNSLDAQQKVQSQNDIDNHVQHLRKLRWELRNAQKKQGLHKSDQIVLEAIPQEIEVVADPDKQSSLTFFGTNLRAEFDPHDTLLSVVGLYDHLRSTQHLPADKMKGFNNVNVVQSRANNESPGTEIQQCRSANDKGCSRRRYTYLGIPNPFSSVRPDTLSAISTDIQPLSRQDNKSRKRRRKTHTYLRHDQRVSEDQYLRFRRGEINNPFYNCTESNRLSDATISDRKDAYRALIGGGNSEASITTTAIRPPKSIYLHETLNRSQWDDASPPSSPY